MVSRFLFSSLVANFAVIAFISLSTHNASAANWVEVEVKRIAEMSDTSSPQFKAVDEKGPLGSGKIVIRCAAEGWGNASPEATKARFDLDARLGLESWKEVADAKKSRKGAYLRGEKMKFHELFVNDETGAEFPRDELSAFGKSEKGFKFRFERKFAECSKMDSETLKPGQDCKVTLQIQKVNGIAAGRVKVKSIKCVAANGAPGANGSMGTPGKDGSPNEAGSSGAHGSDGRSAGKNGRPPER